MAAFGGLICLPTAAQEAASGARTSAGESYRLRVENTQFGRIEVSSDAGRHYLLIGRVLRPATTTLADKTAIVPGIVVRTAPTGITLSAAPGRILRLRPADSLAGSAPQAQGRPRVRTAEPVGAAIVTNLAPGSGVLGELAPRSGSVVSLQTERAGLADLPGDYVPSVNDVLVITAAQAPAGKSEPANRVNPASTDSTHKNLRDRLEALARAYAEGAVARAEAENRTVASGFFKLNAKLPAGEPVPIAFVTYAIDGDLVAAENVAPFTYTWDTRRTGNGEHVVEVRALDAAGNPITSTRALVAVHNEATASGN